MRKLGYTIFLALVAALGGFLFGYDTAVISGTTAQVSEQFDLDAIQLGWYVGCALLGSIFGVAVSGILSDYAGRKKTMFLSAVLFSVSAIGCAFSRELSDLLAYRIIGGIGIGVASVVSPIYISEISMAHYRGRLVSLYQLAVTVGFLGAYLVNFYLLHISQTHIFNVPIADKIFVGEVWRAMLGMEAIPAVFFFIVIFLIPDSPRWLILKQKTDKAQHILNRIYGSSEEALEQVKQTRQVIHTEVKSEWRYLVQPGIFTAVWVGIAIAILGQFMGVNAVLYYGPDIFSKSGLSNGDSLFYQVLVGLVNVITTIIALLIIDKVGRKKLVYWGVSGMVVSLVSIGSYFSLGETLEWGSIILLVFFLFYIFCCAISICAVIFVLLSEMYPIRVRGLAMSLAGFSLWIGTYLIGQLTPWMLETLTPAGTFFIFAFMCLPYLLIVWKKIPETAGKSLEEIEKLWKR
ncbi:MAG: sugar porter family MFS transporter [Prolixibacteraceae bacterium]|jgi:sugar porter (SP) family MFS transporter|nr:sugar porter family MFS transporter [Prolixibacteraceae bacterium]